MNDPYLYLGFDELVNKEAETIGYSLFLINHTSYQLVFQFEWKYNNGTVVKGDGILTPKTSKRIASMDRSQLNDKPSFQINIQPITTSGKESWNRKELKIKAKQFFSKMVVPPQFDRKMHVYELFSTFEGRSKKKANSLLQYTKQQKTTTDEMPFEGTITDLQDIGRLARFPKKIDLHIEKLLPNSKKLPGGEILSIQLKAFERYLEEAITLGVFSFYVVHGKGAGRLEEEIRRRLQVRKEVDSFEGGYHPGFGTGGATKIFLKK